MASRSTLFLAALALLTGVSPLGAQRHSSGARSGNGSTHVRGYTRHDGTYVAPYTRSSPHSYTAPRTGSSPKSYRAPKSSPSTGARDSHGRIKRSREARDDFMRRTGYPRGRPGYVIDHVVPLCAGGADAPSNMQWQTVEAAKAKDRQERAECARGSRH